MSKWEVNEILKERKIKGSSKKEYLIVWANTWEKASNLKGSEALKRFIERENKSKPKSKSKSNDKQNGGKNSEKSVDKEEDESVADEGEEEPIRSNKWSKRGPKGKASKPVDNGADEATPQEDQNGDQKSGSENEKVSVDPRNESSDEGTEGEGDITVKEKALKSKSRSAVKTSSRGFKPPAKKSKNN